MTVGYVYTTKIRPNVIKFVILVFSRMLCYSDRIVIFRSSFAPIMSSESLVNSSAVNIPSYRAAVSIPPPDVNDFLSARLLYAALPLWPGINRVVTVLVCLHLCV